MLGNASGPPGATVNVSLPLKGDGATNGADLALDFSNTRLFIDQPSGVLSGGAAGVCGRRVRPACAAGTAPTASTPSPSPSAVYPRSPWYLFVSGFELSWLWDITVAVLCLGPPSMSIPTFAMCRQWFFCLAGACCLLASTPAWSGESYVFGLHTDPETPVAGQSFSLSLSAPTCDVFWSEGPLDRTVEVVGSILRVTVEYTAPAFEGGCDPATVRTVAWVIGPLTVGSYTREFAGDDPIGGGTREIEQIPLTIVAPVASSPGVVPINAPWMLLLLGLSLTTCAFLVLGVRQ